MAAPDSTRGSAQPAPDQRWLELVGKVGGALVAVGLVATVVIIGLYLAGRPTPGTWAYGVAMLAPLGFGMILLAVAAVALRRRQGSHGPPVDPHHDPSG